MRIVLRHCRVFVFLLLLVCCASILNAQAQQSAASAIGSRSAELVRVDLLGLAKDPRLERAHLGLFVKNLTTGAELLDVNAARLFIPASTMKLFTTAAAISLLGPAYTYQTPLLLHGTVEGGVLRGDLVVRGAGDPSIAGAFHKNDPLAVFESWARALRQRGVERIEGYLVGDASLFPGPPLGDGWNWDDETYWYSAQTGALAFNESTADVVVSAEGEPGAPVRWEIGPVPGYLEVVNDATVGPAGSGSTFLAERRRGENVLEMKGQLPRGQRVRFAVTVEKPAAWFLHALRHVLAANGVHVEGVSRVVRKQEEAREWATAAPVAVHTSPSMFSLATHTNRESHNLYAEQMLMALGAEQRNLGTARAGAETVMSWATALGVGRESLVMVDGSGLSRKNLVSPRAMVALLEGMRTSSVFQPFYESLPVAGCHGSLANRMCGTPAENVASAKVGYVTHNICLAGYTRDASGQWYAYALFVNNHAGPVRDAKALQDGIVAALTAAESP